MMVNLTEAPCGGVTEALVDPPENVRLSPSLMPKVPMLSGAMMTLIVSMSGPRMMLSIASDVIYMRRRGTLSPCPHSEIRLSWDARKHRGTLLAHSHSIVAGGLLLTS